MAGGILILFSLGLACSDPLAPETCTVELESGCWTFLGLEGYLVTALADTPWGVFAGTSDAGVFRLDAGAGSWEALGIDDAGVSSMLFVSEPEPRLLVGMWPVGADTVAGLWATEDRGRTWMPWDGGLAAEHHHKRAAYSLAVDPGDPQRLYMGQSISVLRSLDAGQSWEFVYAGPEYFGNGVSAIVVSPDRDGHVWATANSGLAQGRIYRSEDWGDSWDIQPACPGTGAVMDMVVDEDDPKRLWVAGACASGSVLHSSDSGQSWEPVLNVGLPFLALLKEGKILYAVGSKAVDGLPPLRALRLYRSTDNGSIWGPVAVPAEAAGGWVATFDLEGRVLIGTTEPGGVWRFEP